MTTRKFVCPIICATLVGPTVGVPPVMGALSQQRSEPALTIICANGWPLSETLAKMQGPGKPLLWSHVLAVT